MSEPLELTGRAEATHFWFRGFRQFIAPVIDDLSGGRRDLHILDCGCGTGRNLSFLRTYGQAFGFDVNPVATAMTRAAAERVVRANATQIPFASEAFDLVTTFDMLQFVEDDAAAVREMARLVRPGGRVVLTMAALEVLRGDHAESWQEVRRYTPGMVKRLLDQAGLRAERVSFLFGSLFPLMVTVRFVQRLLRPYREFRHDRDMAVPWPPVNALLSGIVSAEAALARWFPLPIGSSLLVVGTKPTDRSHSRT